MSDNSICLDPNSTALLVVDVQQALFQRATPIYRADELLDTLSYLIEQRTRLACLGLHPPQQQMAAAGIGGVAIASQVATGRGRSRDRENTWGRIPGHPARRGTQVSLGLERSRHRPCHQRLRTGYLSRRKQTRL